MRTQPLRVLGLHDAHDSGVTLLEDGRFVYAASEERFSRKKFHWGFPNESLRNLFETTGVEPASIDAVAISGQSKFEVGETMALSFDAQKINMWKRHGETIARTLGPLTDSPLFARAVKGVGMLQRPRAAVRATLRSYGITAPVRFYDHHACHAASAYFTAGTDPVLVLTADYSGDGVSGTVSVGRDGRLTRIAHASVVHSSGRFWDVITHLCGFKPTRHAGKITGLAAYKPSPEAYARLRMLYGGNASALRFENKERRVWLGEAKRIRDVLPGATREELAYAAQKVLEEAYIDVLRAAIQRTGIRDIALAGGTFANVRLNQLLVELPEVNSIHIFPHMGDGGLCTGAAFFATAERTPLHPFLLEHMYYGPQYDESAIRAAAQKHGLALETLDNPAERIACELAAKRVIGVYQGRMEYGPRALGNRSILAEPADPTMMDWLNKRLARTEFMPFAPMILEDAAPRYFKNFSKFAYATKFMTICCECTEEAKQKAPGIVHKDGTARPQSVSERRQPLIADALRRYNELTGLPLCVNTSFNKHEEPIVCTPEDAVKEFLRGGVDTLIIGGFAARAPVRESSRATHGVAESVQAAR
ncbi:MAG: carbamoyltransferase [Parcubacteria group bacterium Gr01-1014_38]|nr:MAG: carbamoyltransferase [Parcubacteria group bacterium Gr01-1014_38]